MTTPEKRVDDDTWKRQLRENRAEKDSFFADHRQSPIPPEQRAEFDGLEYFDPDPTYRVVATVTLHEEPVAVTMETSEGLTVDYNRVATLRFELAGAHHELAGYRQSPEDGSLFVPFRDKTTGQETYQGGRYMELEVEGQLADGAEIVLDFNLAYSPFCAYSETFACPLPPEENWLETTIEAGEKF